MTSNRIPFLDAPCEIVSIVGNTVRMNVEGETTVAIIQLDQFSARDRMKLRPGAIVDYRVYFEDTEGGRRFKVSEAKVRA